MYKLKNEFSINYDKKIIPDRLNPDLDKNLEKEAQRIITKLPRMTPGIQRGRAVRVPYSVPITFRLQ